MRFWDSGSAHDLGCVKGEAKRRIMGIKGKFRESDFFWHRFIGKLRASGVIARIPRIPEKLAGLTGAIKLLARDIVAQMIAPIVGKPKFVRFRVERQPDRVANPACINFGRAPIDRNGNDRAFKATDLADIARRSDCNKQTVAIRRQRSIPPAMMAFIGQIGKQDARTTKGFTIEIGKIV